MTTTLTEHAAPFLDYLDDWHAALPSMSLAELLGTQPERVALISIDVINGFCKAGPLASERVGRISQPIAELFQRAYELGARNFILTQDTHAQNAPEFSVYPPHCLAGTAESEATDELKALPFFDAMVIIPKNSINSHLGTPLGAWVAAHSEVDRFVIVGDCTDLCTYSAAMHLRLEANALNLDRRVIVPADVVDTFDTPVSVARDLGIHAHDGDLHNIMFLHHMALNGVEVVQELT